MATIDGTLNQDTYITGYEPTTNKNGIALLIGDNGGGDKARALLKFTLPANPGSATITDIKISIYRTGANGSGSYSINAHNGTSTPATTWVDSQATWNIYKTATNWTVAGAGSDFISTIVGSYARTGSSPLNSYWDIPIQGTGATNPLSLNWGDTVNLLIAAPSSAGNNDLFHSSSQANPPKITITYTVGATSHIKSADGVLYANIKSADGAAAANIKSASGVANA